MSKPDPLAQFRSRPAVDVERLMESHTKLQLAVAQLQTVVFEMRQREIERMRK
ncbi:MAG: hypothetical protein J7496_08615 [Novosphingobium sp.]|nr:hypothetical protein [Novosphingobium sp.]